MPANGRLEGVDFQTFETGPDRTTRAESIGGKRR